MKTLLQFHLQNLAAIIQTHAMNCDEGQLNSDSAYGHQKAQKKRTFLENVTESF
jgi:hypothetical protein